MRKRPRGIAQAVLGGWGGCRGHERCEQSRRLRARGRLHGPRACKSAGGKRLRAAPFAQFLRMQRTIRAFASQIASFPNLRAVNEPCWRRFPGLKVTNTAFSASIAKTPANHSRRHSKNLQSVPRFRQMLPSRSLRARQVVDFRQASLAQTQARTKRQTLRPVPMPKPGHMTLRPSASPSS